MNRTLPGFEPAYIRVDLTRTPEGSWTVTEYVAEGPGFVCAADGTTYGPLTYLEATDVVGACLDAFSGAAGGAG